MSLGNYGLYPMGDGSGGGLSVLPKHWRFRSVARRVVAQVERNVAQVIRKSPFLQQETFAATHHYYSTCGYFHRSEIEKGRRIGMGGSAEVVEIRAFHLSPDITRELGPEQNQVRQRMKDTALLKDGTCKYVMKYIKESLLEQSGELLAAVTDLAVEGAYLAALDHPNIISLQGTAVDGIQALSDGSHDGFFIILERLECTLESRINQWRGQTYDAMEHQGLEQEKICFALQVANALQYLHERRIVVRDVKCSNLGFTRGNATLLQLFDFGYCRQLPEGGFDAVYSMSDVGTERFTAPEVLSKAPYNCKVDVYAWSIVFWETLSLQKAYYHSYSCYKDAEGGNHPLEEQIVGSGIRPPIPSQWPESLRRILQNSWEKDIAKRWSMSQVVDALQAILNQQTFAVGAGQQDGDAAVAAVMEHEAGRFSLTTAKGGSCSSDEEDSRVRIRGKQTHDHDNSHHLANRDTASCTPPTDVEDDEDEEALSLGVPASFIGSSKNHSNSRVFFLWPNLRKSSEAVSACDKSSVHDPLIGLEIIISSTPEHMMFY